MSHAPETIAMWLERILGHEGSFTNDPTDPGNWTTGIIGQGLLKGTKWGIAANTYEHLDIVNLTVEDAVQIFIDDFLKPIKADQLRDGVAFQMLDFAINSGPRRAKRELQQAIGVKSDGFIGPITLAALQARDESDLVILLIAERLDFMSRLSNWPRHGRGWVRRMAANLRYAAEDT